MNKLNKQLPTMIYEPGTLVMCVDHHIGLIVEKMNVYTGIENVYLYNVYVRGRSWPIYSCNFDII